MKRLGLFNCFKEMYIDLLSQATGVDKNVINKYFMDLKLKISKTPDPSLGDYGLSLHYLFHKHNIPPSDWSVVGEKVIGLLKNSVYVEKCFVKDARYVNGYVNIYIDYDKLFKKIAGDVLDNTFFNDIKTYGGSERVLVEHTSANPIHPLHIGSGRNSIIGNTFARLLRYLGFDAEERFYVNDMGRQVAILVYGYSLVKESGLKPREGVKIDHWFGAIYSLTNIFLEKGEIYRKMRDLEKLFHSNLNNYLKEIEGWLKESNAYSLLNHYIALKNTVEKLGYRHDTGILIKNVVDETRNILNIFGNEPLVGDRIKHYLRVFEDIHSKYNELYEEIISFSEAENNICSVYPEICNVLRSSIGLKDDVEKTISDLMKKYENGDEEVAQIFHEVVYNVLNGFKQTLERLGIVFNSYDWESGEAGRKHIDEIIGKVVELPYTVVEGEAVLVDLDKASKEHRYIAELFGDDQPGKVVLRRSDGTTLYTTRDVAYSIYKFVDLGFNKVYNVIAVEQVREQKQVKSILYLIGYKELVDRLTHFIYEMVHLKGMRMSGRRGQYYTMDELIDDYVKVVSRNYIENQIKLGFSKYVLNEKELIDSFEKLGVACSRALLLSIDPDKVLTFEPSRLESYDLGSWIIYTFVRLQSILRKAFDLEPLDNTTLLIDKAQSLYDDIKNEQLDLNSDEKELIEIITNYHETLIYAYEYMKPNKILEYTNNLCNVLNKIYESYPIIGEKDVVKKNTRLLLVVVSVLLLRDLLWILGFPLIKKL